MAHKIIDIPGQTTGFEACPKVTFTGGGNTSMSITISYQASYVSHDLVSEMGEITFSDVLEFRWIESNVDYEAHPEHEDDYAFGLIEILNSAYVETMASRGGWRNQPENRIRNRPESEVRHFRMAFDDWGRLDILATEIVIATKIAP